MVAGILLATILRMEKTCTICKQSKPLEAFHRSCVMKRDGRIKQCKKCVMAKRKGQHDWIRMRYGVTKEEYESMIADQEGRCKLCLRPTKRLCVDHCHSTMRIRGLLCNKCNVAIALLGEDETLFCRAIDYLKPPGDSAKVVYADPDRGRRRAKSKAFIDRLAKGEQGDYHILKPPS